ncbi:MAG: hypothetical protein DRG59_09930, partial [Deltaproteobacteria bacterium]
SRSIAREVLSNFTSLIPYEIQMYDFEVVQSEEEFLQFFSPFELTTISELVRPADQISLGAKDFYIIHPFSESTNTFSKIVRALMYHKNPVVFSITLKPARLFPWEMEILHKMNLEQRELLSDYEKNPSSFKHKQLKAGISLLHDLQHNNYYSSLCRAWDRLFLTKIQIASNETIPQYLKDLIGTEISGNLTFQEEITTDREGLPPKSSYRFIEPENPTQRNIALNNLKYSEFERWFSADAPEGLERLIYLTDPREASCAAKLVVPVEEELPGISLKTYREIPAPVVVTTKQDLQKDEICLGENVYYGIKRPIYIPDEARRRHIYIIGQTGTGKSALMRYLIMQDIKAGKTVSVIDPHGDLVEDLLNMIPKNREKDVVIFDPSDTQYPFALRLLEAKSQEEKELIIDGIFTLFLRLWPASFTGPVFQEVSEMAIRSLLEVKSFVPSFSEIPRLITDDHFLQLVITEIDDPEVKDYWENEWPNIKHEVKKDATYFTSKFRKLISNHIIRNIVGQEKTLIDFDEIVNGQKIFLVTLQKGKIGEQNAQFLGSLLMLKLQNTILARSRIKPERRKDFYLYVDEFHNFLTESFPILLAEGRKYKVNLVLAHQHLEQLRLPPIEGGPSTDLLINAIFGNAGTLIVFRTGHRDAINYLTGEFANIISANEFVNMPNYKAIVRLLSGKEAGRIFTLNCLYEQVPRNGTLVNRLIELSRQQYATPLAEVENFLTQKREFIRKQCKALQLLKEIE